MKKRIKQNLTLMGVIGVICTLILVLFAFMMPPNPFALPTVTKMEAEADPKETGNKPIVVIDPGHGGYDEGSSSVSGVIEKDINLEISMKIKALLEEEGVNVVLTRDSDEVSWGNSNVEDLQARLDIATNAQAAMMVSIHCNISDEDMENVKGSEVYTNMSQQASVDLAEAINAQLEKLSPQLENRGVKTGQLHLLTFNTVPTVIVEMGFLSNESDTAYLTGSDTQKLLCEAIVKGIMDQIKTNQ